MFYPHTKSPPFYKDIWHILLHQSILDLPNLYNEVYLGVGALTGIYCRDHDCHNVKSDGVAAVSSKFAAKLQNCKPKNKQEEDRVRIKN